MIWTMKIDAEDQIKKKAMLTAAKNLKNLGVETNVITQATGLPAMEIDEL